MLLGSLGLALLAVIATPLAGRAGRNAGFYLSLPLAAAAAALVGAWLSGDARAQWDWIPALGVQFALHLDGLALLFGLLVTVIGAGVLFYAARYLGAGVQTRFYLLMTVFALAMLALVLTDDVVVLFVAWEATTLCSFFLIARSGPHAREPAIRTLLVTAMGGLSLLAAVVTMAVAAGTTSITQILAAPFWSEQPVVTAWVAVLLAIAAFTKSAQFPFQAWLPDSMAAITPVSAYLHAAAMVKAGIYLLLRFSPVLREDALWMALLIASGAITALLGAWGAMRQSDLKALLAYSTISQLGLLVLLIGVGTEEALTAAVVHTIAHALFKAALFMVVGVIDHRAGTREIHELARLRIRMPVTVAAGIAAAVSMAGVPPLLGFVSKESMFDALLAAPGPSWLPAVATTAAVLTAVLTFAYAGRFVLGMLGRGPGDVVAEARTAFWAVPALLAAGGVLLGVLPGSLDPLIAPASSAAVGRDIAPYLELWHGFTPALLVSALVIASGTALVLLRRRTAPVFARRVLPFGGLDVVDHARTGTIAFGALVGRASGRLTVRRHLAIPVAVLVIIAVLLIPAVGALPASAAELMHPLDWVLVALVLAGTLGAVLAGTRVAAVVVTGVVGFAMTLWYFWLGAADVALTQLLVEILTVCVMVLILRRLPRRFHRDSRRRRISSGAVAIAAGAATTAGVLAFTGRRELSDAAEWFLRNAETETGGGNIVNTILVDFRALDTFGELTVLGIAGVAIAALLSSRPTVEIPDDVPSSMRTSPIGGAAQNAVFAGSLARWVGPATVLVSIVLLLRGHYEPGGGFIAALVGGAGFALLYLAAPSDESARIRLPYLALIGGGVAIAALTGLAGYADGSFLRPLHLDVLGVKLTSALVFDVGVYLAVIGVVLAALNLLGVSRHRQPAPTTDHNQERSTA